MYTRHLKQKKRKREEERKRKGTKEERDHSLARVNGSREFQYFQPIGRHHHLGGHQIRLILYQHPNRTCPRAVQQLDAPRVSFLVGKPENSPL